VRIFIDPGHGGSDPGAVGLYGTKESYINLLVAHALDDALMEEGFYRISLSREGDRFVSLRGRSDEANKMGAGAFISIHCNANINRQAHGFEIYTTPGVTRSDALATSIYEEWETSFPGRRVRPDWADGDPDKEANYSVLRNTKMPAVLVELDFISNPKVEEWLNIKTNQKAMAETIARGVKNWVQGV